MLLTAETSLHCVFMTDELCPVWSKDCRPVPVVAVLKALSVFVSRVDMMLVVMRSLPECSRVRNKSERKASSSAVMMPCVSVPSLDALEPASAGAVTLICASGGGPAGFGEGEMEKPAGLPPAPSPPAVVGV